MGSGYDYEFTYELKISYSNEFFDASNCIIKFKGGQNNKPVIKNISVNNKDFNLGDKVTITAQLDNYKEGIDKFYVCLWPVYNVDGSGGGGPIDTINGIIDFFVEDGVLLTKEQDGLYRGIYDTKLLNYYLPALICCSNGALVFNYDFKVSNNNTGWVKENGGMKYYKNGKAYTGWHYMTKAEGEKVPL